MLARRFPVRWPRRTVLAWAALAALPAAVRHTGRASGSLLIDPADLAQLPMTGPAWQALLAASQLDTSSPNLANQNDATNVRVLAKALVAARTSNDRLRGEVADALVAIVGTQQGGRTLALGRELAAYVISADLIGLDGASRLNFEAFLERVRVENLNGRTLISAHRDRPNNWGAHAGASRAAVALYLGDDVDLRDTASVLRGFLGDRDAHAGFQFGESWWQANPLLPVGVNPVGAEIDGWPVDGVLPDDQRRAGRFQWPPRPTNYTWEALQGLLLQAILLDRAGYGAWAWRDRAILRAVRWLVVEADHPPTGDDLWQLAVIKNFYPDPGFALPDVPWSVASPRPGKGFGYTDFLYPIG